MVKHTPENEPGYTTVSIYDQVYHLRGQDPDHIRQIAELVDSKMRAVAAHGRTVDSLRVAVLAALNLADELSESSGGGAGANAKDGRVRAANLRNMLDEVLEEDLKTGS